MTATSELGGAAQTAASGVVLVHGIISSRYLLPTVRELARLTRVLVPDLPGFGADDPPNRVPDLASQADAVAAAMGAWEGAGATVIGHSLGAEVVVELARRHPSMVGRAVLVGPTGDPGAANVFGIWSRWMASAVSEPLSFNLLTVAELVRLGPRRMAKLMERSFSDPLEAKLSEVTCPTLLVRGARDRVAPQSWLNHVAAQIPDAVAVTLAEGGHTLVYTHPARLTELVVRFASEAKAGQA